MAENEKDNSVDPNKNWKKIILPATITVILIAIFAFVFLLRVNKEHPQTEQTKTTEDVVENSQTKSKQPLSKIETEAEEETEISDSQNEEIETNLPEMLEIAGIEFDDLKKEIDRFSSMPYDLEIEKEKAFKKLLENFEAAENKLNDSGIVSNQSIPENIINKYSKKFNKFGYEIAFDYGQYYFRIHYPYVMKISDIPESWKEYLELQNTQRNSFSCGRGTMHANEEAVPVLIKFDEFIKKYPEFIEINNTKEQFNIYLFQFLHGWDKTFRFHLNDDYKMKQEYVNSIQKLINDYPDFSKHEVVKEYYEKLQANDFALCEDKNCEKKKFDNWLWEKIEKEKK